MSFVERFIIIQCPYFGGSTIGGSTVLYTRKFWCFESCVSYMYVHTSTFIVVFNLAII